ncbi:MAG: SHOCT domain-containing protein [Solirubrobacterales bacterium]
MGYLVKAPLGLAMFIGGIVLFNVKLVSLLETGTCASGNVNFQIAPGHQCPSGTGADILLLMAGIIGGLIGAGIFAIRGDPPWDKDRPLNSASDFSFGLFAWGLFFAATGATSLVASLTNQAIRDSNGGELGGLIVGATFLLMGVPALLLSLWRLGSGLGRRDERPAVSTATAGIGGFGGGGMMSRISSGLNQARSMRQLSSRSPWGSTGSTSSAGGGTAGQIAKLERLQKLRESGALTDPEFQREKTKILSES